MRALFAGSFHPPTVGHADVICRSAAMFDSLIVAVMVNSEKKYLLSAEERVKMLKKICAPYSNVSVIASDGLTAETARRMGAGVLVRGVRGGLDVEYEIQIADINRRLTGIDTVFIPSLPENRCVSSTVVNDIARHGGAFEGLIPGEILDDFKRAMERWSEGA